MVARGIVPLFLLKAVWPRLSQVPASPSSCTEVSVAWLSDTLASSGRPRKRKQRGSPPASPLLPTGLLAHGGVPGGRDCCLQILPTCQSQREGLSTSAQGSALMKVTPFHRGAPAAQRGCCCPRRAGLGAGVKVPSCSACVPPMTSASLLSGPSTPPGPGLQGLSLLWAAAAAPSWPPAPLFVPATPFLCSGPSMAPTTSEYSPSLVPCTWHSRPCQAGVNLTTTPPLCLCTHCSPCLKHLSPLLWAPPRVQV